MNSLKKQVINDNENQAIFSYIGPELYKNIIVENK